MNLHREIRDVCVHDFAIMNKIMFNHAISIPYKMTSVFRFDYYGLALIMTIRKRFLLEKMEGPNHQRCK